jgi:ribonucleoside-diphosphate reductase alpha chain
MWTSDLFMKRVQENGKWIMCPSECPGLYDVYGEEFENVYCYEEARKKNNQSRSCGRRF